jgi:hypothetical protein
MLVNTYLMEIVIMLEKRSKDGKYLCIGRYDFVDCHFAVDCYNDGKLVYTYQLLEYVSSTKKYIMDTIKAYDLKHPTTNRYHKLTSGDIYCNETETVINHNALMDLLAGLESADKTVISEAIEMLS